MTLGRSEGKSGKLRKIDPNFNIFFPTTACSLTFHKTNMLHNDLKKDAINEFGIKYWTSNPVWVKFQEGDKILCIFYISSAKCRIRVIVFNATFNNISVISWLLNVTNYTILNDMHKNTYLNILILLALLQIQMTW